MLTADQKIKMSQALEKAVSFFSGDTETQLRISQAHETLKACTDNTDLTIVSDFVCGLHLVSIARTGLDLNGTPYYTRFEGLPAVYAIRPKTENGVLAVKELSKQFEDIQEKESSKI